MPETSTDERAGQRIPEPSIAKVGLISRARIGQESGQFRPDGQKPLI
jgi:hypothetical protein